MRSAPKSRFLPGELISGRYRIVAVLGRGGMGEIYRADDLVLEQPVALKFLRAEIGADPASRERFLSEVKLARAVTHPNVCRVHDVGDLDGQLYLSMEYVDGEDLAALLRRIGAPSEKKGLEIAAQLCAGLSAAHARGVLHRDLKPANVMIDGAGKVRITDFGLAILEEDERGRGLVAGTPAYMAPEQLAGSEATAKSDIYALGLVLYELFTGVRVWMADDLGQLRQQHATRTPESPRLHARAIDERIERAILACLEREPSRRPRSPTAVAAALAGMDPIAAALAAGETPTPEMVAASGGEGTISLVAATSALIAIATLFVALIFVVPRASLYGHVALEDDPAVLAHRAREILKELDLFVPDGDRAYGFSPGWLQQIDRNQLDANFWYRESPVSLQPSAFLSSVSPEDPPLHSPGMVSLQLSARGRLERLEAVPVKSEDAARSSKRCDWNSLFAAAGLSAANFEPSDAQGITPPQVYDERAAWTGSDPEQPGTKLHIGGAGFGGRPVFFAPIPWTAPSQSRDLEGSETVHLVHFWAWLLSLSGGIALARRNWKRGIGDRRAATRLAVVIALCDLTLALLSLNHTTDLFLEREILVQALARALFDGGNTWVLYLALEPYVRRLWPDQLVSWSRLLAGRWRDPLVARAFIAGLGAGVLATLAGFAQAWGGTLVHATQAMHVTRNFPDAAGLRATLAQACYAASDGVAASFILLFSLVVLRFLVRRNWIAYTLFVPLLIFGNQFANPTGLPMLDWTYWLFVAALFLLVAVRFGVFAVAIMVATLDFLNVVPLTSDLGAWYAPPTIVAAIVVGGLAFAAARFATGNRAQAS